MTNNTAIDIDKISIDNIIYKDRKSKNDKSAISISYKDKSTIKNFIVQTPTFFNFKLLNKKNNYYELYIPLTGKKENKIDEFIDLIEKIDKKIIYDAHINSSNWFNESVKKENDDQKYSYRKIKKNSISILRNRNINLENYSNIDPNKGFLKVKIYDDKSLFKTVLQLDKKNINLSEIPNKSFIKMILHFNSLIINKKYFEINIKPLLISFSTITDEKIINNNLNLISSNLISSNQYLSKKDPHDSHQYLAKQNAFHSNNDKTINSNDSTEDSLTEFP